MKKLNLLFTALLLMCCVGTAKAVEVTIDGIRYDVITKAKQATVISGGNYSGDIVIPSEITYNNVTCSVTSIGSSAFYRCSGLTSITIPNSVTSIGYQAFAYCYGLTSVTIGNSVTSIGNEVFDDCTALTNIVIPSSVTSIGKWAFATCSAIETIVVDSENNVYDSRNNCNAIIETATNKLVLGCKNTVIPSDVTAIGYAAFDGCTGLTQITIPNSITNIEGDAFIDCSGLKEVHINDIAAWCNIDFEDNPLYYAHNLYLNNELITELVIPNGVTSIGSRAFQNCSGLTSITIPNSVTSIGNYAFYYCDGLTSVTIGNSVTSIGWCAFYNCSGLTSITIPNSVTSIGEEAFGYCSGLTSVTIGSSVTSIGNSAFSSCSGLKTVINLSNLTFSKGSYDYGYIARYADNVYNAPNGSIEGDYIFCKLNNVNTLVCYLDSETELTLPADYKGESYVIGASAFNGNNTITSITIPNSVTSIGNQAFSDCENLTDVYCLATDVPTTKSDAFSGSYPEYMTLHVPAEAINSYKTTEPWSSFGNVVAIIIEKPKCAAPVIEYYNGELVIECETTDAEFVTAVTNDYTGNYNSNAIALTATYNISVYATAAGYDNSDTVNATLCWIECDCSANDNTTDVINIPAKAVFVTSSNGNINISCSLEGEVVELYTSDAMYIGSTTIENGTATIESGLSKGDIAIIKIAEKSIKVILN